ncbi:hypothetical protein M3J09_008384 [Ascochyta lentis]
MECWFWMEKGGLIVHSPWIYRSSAWKLIYRKRDPSFV